MWKTKLFQNRKVCYFRATKKGRMKIQPEDYPISKSQLGLVSPRQDSNK
jgi:hypothetical protein